MPRKAAGARLYQRPDTGVFYIRDTGERDRSTGTRSRDAAEKALAAYIVSKGAVTDTRHPDRFPVTEALAIYARDHGSEVARPDVIGTSLMALIPFWSGLTVGDVKGETCRRYARSRVTTRGAPEGETRAISQSSTRRELGVLQAAINFCHREGYLTYATKVTRPEAPPARDRWLTRAEAARMLWAVRGEPRRRHLARFILVALYTGTRKDAILRLGFLPNTAGGWVDVDQGVLHRRGTQERETKKRRPPMKLSRKLLAHCRRWRAMGDTWVVSYQGQRVGSIKRSFNAVCEGAGLEDVTPHTLKHTAITWAMQKGMQLDDAAHYFGTSRETIMRVYWHHSPHFQQDAVAVMDRKV